MLFEETPGYNCPVTSCTLKAPGCGSSYVAGRLSIGVSSPFDISGANGVTAGWTETACVECSNGVDVVQEDITIK